MTGVQGAAVLLWSTALGFGLPGLYGAWHLARHERVWTLFGFPTYGDGPFVRIGVPTTVPLFLAFVAVCAAEAAAGWLLWQGQVSGGVLALVLVPVGAVFWWGFALPLPPVAAVAWTALVLVGWDSLG